MIDTIKCKKAALYHNTSRLTLTQVKAKTGCTHIINGYLFNTKFKPLGWTVIDGKVISKDQYNDWGIAFDKTGSPKMSTDRTKSFLSGIPILKNGARVYRNLTPDVARKAERTAVGWYQNGRILLWCDSLKLTREELQLKLISMGVSDAIMLDGGGSTQCIFPDGKLYSSRKVPTMLLFWDEDAKSDPMKTPTETGCPYSEPTKLIKKGSLGSGAKWVQWQLNRHGASLVVDGNFGKASEAELIEFQKKSGLTADSICGPATRAVLKL